MLKDWQLSLLTVIHCAITEEPGSLPDDFLTNQILSTAIQQQIDPIVFYGARRCGILQNTPEMQKIFERTVQLMLIDEAQTQEIHTLCRRFEAEGIDYMLLKGSVLKALYPKREMRTMSDADILIRMEQYDKIKEIVQALGYQEGVESDHELHWDKKSLHLELHKRLIPSYNQDYALFFGNCWDSAKLSEGSEHSYQMSEEDTYLYLFTHFAKHYRDGGIGAKHLIDLWLYRRNHSALDESYLADALATLHLSEFYRNVRSVEAVWFENAEATELTDFISNVLLTSGPYGKQQQQGVSWALRVSGGSKSDKKVRFRWKLQQIFLPYWRMCLKYPFLKKLPFLLPIMWPVRWISSLIYRRDKIKKEREKSKQITTESISEYRSALEYVGLSYENEGKV